MDRTVGLVMTIAAVQNGRSGDILHVMSATADRPAPRERLLAAADDLFYGEGVCSVGVDRILREADVARASLYSSYGSKQELVKAYLGARSAAWQALVAEALP